MPKAQVTGKGKTVEEAYQAALQLLLLQHPDVCQDQVQVEVLEAGRQWPFKILTRAAKVRLVIPAQFGQYRQARLGFAADADGLTAVQGGRLQVSDPLGKGRTATIIPARGTAIRVNGILLKQAREIRQDDRVELEALEEDNPAGLEIDVSHDGLTVWARVTPRRIIRYEILDQEAQNVLQIAATRQEERITAITAEDTERFLAEKGVRYGIDQQALQEVVKTADGTKRVVARGTPVQEGRDAFIEHLFSPDPVEIVYGEEEDANFWEKYLLPSVKEGDVLAICHPSQLGKPGRKVTGEEITPRPVRDAKLIAKEGVTLSEDGRVATANAVGRPVLSGFREKAIQILPLLVHAADVDIRSGNLRFGGDLLILGQIKEGMEVAAHGDLTVMADAARAVLHAGGRAILRGNAINCQVYAGGLKTFYDRLAPLFEVLKEILRNLAAEVRDGEQRLNWQGRGPVDSKEARRRLMDMSLHTRAEEISRVSSEISTVLAEVRLAYPTTIRQVANSIAELARGDFRGQGQNTPNLEYLLSQYQTIVNLLDSLPTIQGDIFCSYIQNCTLQTSGNITVSGEGCYNSRLSSGSRVIVKGFFRGGEVAAVEAISIREVGAPDASLGSVSIRVSEGGTVRLGRVYPEAVVYIGKVRHTFDQPAGNVSLFLDQDGGIRVEGSRFKPL